MKTKAVNMYKDDMKVITELIYNVYNWDNIPN